VGKDYVLKLTDTFGNSREMSLSQWYKMIKKDFVPTKKDINLREIEKGEDIYLISNRIKLFAQKENPILYNHNEKEFPWKACKDTHYSYIKYVGWGNLLLSNERLFWNSNNTLTFFWLKKINSVFNEANVFFSIWYGDYKYKFRFYKDSILKWLNYIGWFSEEIFRKYKHKIRIANY